MKVKLKLLLKVLRTTQFWAKHSGERPTKEDIAQDRETDTQISQKQVRLRMMKPFLEDSIKLLNKAPFNIHGPKAC